MSLHFKNPTVLLGWGIGTRLGRGGMGHYLEISDDLNGDPKQVFDTEDYDVEVILTPKFKPGWYAHKSSSNSYEVRFFEDDPETMFGRGTWHKTTEPVEAEK